MVMLITEPSVERDLIAARRASGIDQHDEVWDGVYVVSPIADNEHQFLVGRIYKALEEIVAGGDSGDVLPGANISDRKTDWRKNYRVPDVAVFLHENSARDCGTHWFGGPDFAVEIVSPGDRSRDKLAFYAKVGDWELLIVDRNPWSLELYRLEEGELCSVGRSLVATPRDLVSRVLPLTLTLRRGKKRPGIEIRHHDGRRQWRA